MNQLFNVAILLWLVVHEIRILDAEQTLDRFERGINSIRSRIGMRS